MTQRNQNRTALPARHPTRQSQRHGAAHATPSPPITAAQRCCQDALPTNPNGTPPHTQHAHHQSHDTPTTNLPTAQRGDTATKQPRHKPILEGHSASGKSRTCMRSRARSCANGRDIILKNRNEHGPAPRPPTVKKQEPFAAHSGKKKHSGYVRVHVQQNETEGKEKPPDDSRHTAGLPMAPH